MHALALVWQVILADLFRSDSDAAPGHVDAGVQVLPQFPLCRLLNSQARRIEITDIENHQRAGVIAKYAVSFLGRLMNE